MAKENKTNKPFYKKWWFIAAAIIIVIAAASGGGDEEAAKDDPEQVETSADQKSEPKKELTAEEKAAAEQKAKEEAEAKAKKEAAEAKKIKAGTYKVGTEIAAGEYLVIAKSMGYIESSSDSSGQLSSIIFNDNLMDGGHTYITLNAGEYFKMKGAVMYPVTDAPSVIPADGLYKNGTFKVGKDIPAGEYKVMLDSGMGYLEVSSNSSHQLTSIVTNENVTADTYITVKDGQYLKLNGVKIQK